MPRRWLGSYVTSSYDPLSSTELTVLDERLDGSTSGKAAASALAIKLSTGTNANGQYWINLPVVGPTLTYCIMDSAYDGGGWMMAMKATRGTTFNYASAHWTTATTLNPANADQSDGDAKFDTMNYFPAKDMLARWPDIGAGGSIGGLGNWIWLQNNFFSLNGNTVPRIQLINFFNEVTSYSFSTGKAFSGWGSGTFSSQSGIGWYGYNYNLYASAKVRWGFAWNNETSWGSNDVSNGIGMIWNSYSAGDLISCCQDTTGINRTARVEMYVR